LVMLFGLTTPLLLFRVLWMRCSKYISGHSSCILWWYFGIPLRSGSSIC
jgi:hypothetical protein